MINRCLLILATGIAMSMNLSAQSGIPAPFKLNESLLESIESLNGESADYESILNDLEELQKDPLDLNTASREQFEKLPFLTDFQINSLLEYRKENGNLISVYELQVIYGFTREVIDMLSPFVIVKSPGENRSYGLRSIYTKPHEEVIFRFQRVLEKSKGYFRDEATNRDRAYPGSPWMLNARYMIESGERLFSGVTVEKDPGESLFRGSNKNGFDFISAYLMLKNTGIVKTAVIGDYRLAFGQGLTLWNGAAPGKSSMPLNIIKRQDGIKTFTSNDENNFFRGAAVTVSNKMFTASLFFSSKKRDANITDTLEGNRIWFSSFQESGYHRTGSEISDEKSVRETVMGANLSFHNSFMKAGSTLVSTSLDKYMEAGNEMSDVHDFTGRRLVNFGIDYSAGVRNLRLFGETSGGNGRWATLNGLVVNVNKYAAFSILYRNFSPGYYSMHTAAFSEGSADKNEEGFFMGTVLHPFARLTVSAYTDMYRFPWLKKGRSAPSVGSDYLVQADYSAGKNVDMYIRLKFEKDPGDSGADTLITPDLEEIQNSGARFHISYKLSRRLLMQNRVEYSTSNPGGKHASKGYLVYHNIGYELEKLPVEFNMRLSWFHTDDFSSRIYAYEQDMTSGFSFSPLYGKGFRGYIMCTADISKSVSASIRFSNSWFSDRNTIGSGHDQISSNMRNDVKVRVVVRM